MADKVKLKSFPTAFKLAAIKRLEAGEAVLPLARKPGVLRKVLHDKRKAWKLHGPAGFMCSRTKTSSTAESKRREGSTNSIVALGTRPRLGFGTSMTVTPAMMCPGQGPFERPSPSPGSERTWQGRQSDERWRS